MNIISYLFISSQGFVRTVDQLKKKWGNLKTEGKFKSMIDENCNLFIRIENYIISK